MHTIAVADDLSGAAETAAAFLRVARNAYAGSAFEGPRIKVHLVPEDLERLELEDVADQSLVLDIDSRGLAADDSASRLSALLVHVETRVPRSPVFFLKVDSLLRGEIAAQLEVLGRRGPVVFAVALPLLGRSTVGGVVHSESVPMHETDLWSAEKGVVPTSIAEALSPLVAEVVPLNVIRGEPAHLRCLLDEVAARNSVAICDAESDEDLDTIARAALQLQQKDVHLAGTSALGAALCRAMEPADRPGSQTVGFRSRHPDQSSSNRPVPEGVDSRNSILLIVGTASAQSRMQLEILASSGVRVVYLSSHEFVNWNADIAAVERALAEGPVAVAISGEDFDPAVSSSLSSALAQRVAPLAQQHPLVLTGGATARAVLDFLDIRWLEPIAEFEHGAVLSRTDRRGLVVTRPGSFGGSSSLAVIVEQFHSYLALESALRHGESEGHINEIE